MREKKIYLSPPHLSGKELSFIESAINSNWITTLGSHLDEFENEIKAYLNTQKEVVTLNSGTSAIHLALRLLNIQSGDIVLCQSLTFVASTNPITYLGATPVFIDSERETWNMCPELLEEAIKILISQGKRPKAIIGVHLYGMPYKVSAIHSISKTYGIPIIEDSAEALGSTYKGQSCGTFGDYAIFSFNGNKIITTSGGGALIVKNQKEKDLAIYFASQAKEVSEPKEYNHLDIGYNYRLSNILAALGIAQMKVLPERVKSRQLNFENYQKELETIQKIEFLQNPKGCKSNRWLTTILLPDPETKSKLLKLLVSNNIEARPLWKPMHQQPIFKEFQQLNNGVSDDLFSRGLCLPSGSNLQEEELKFITKLIIKFFKKA